MRSTGLSERQVVADNLAVLRLLDGRDPAGPWSAEDQATLSTWHGWGAAPRVFDAAEHASTRDELARLLGRDGVSAAARTTLNAHYTDPQLVDELWRSVTSLGIAGGPVLEPGCGSGEVLAAAPAGFAGVGVELDPATARVAAARLAGAGHEVVTGSFAEVRVQDGTASAVVGNVPFGRFALYDPEHNPARVLSIHDHFLLKSVTALAPGGVAAVITSRFTLDARTPAGRMTIGEHADFLGAVRLPSNAHRAHAGTGVVTDLVLLRRRAEGEPANHAEGFLDRPVEFGEADDRLSVSAYWSTHQDHIAGDMTTRTSQYGYEVDVVAGSDWYPRVQAAVAAMLAETPQASAPAPADGPMVETGPAKAVPVGRISYVDGEFVQQEPGGEEPLKVASTQRRELLALLRLRDGAEDLVSLEGDGQAAEEVVEAKRTDVRALYTAYAGQFGPLNRVGISASGRETKPPMGGFRRDPSWSRVSALEVFDKETGRAAPATLLEHRVLWPVEPITEASTPADALALSVHQRGRVDEGLIGRLLGVDEERVEAALGDLVIRDPELTELVALPDYLSGNVRAKLRVAETAAKTDPSYQRHVDVLTPVVPRDVVAEDLSGLLGAPWVPREVVRDYVAELTQQGDGVRPGEIRVSRAETTGGWHVEVASRLQEHLGEDHMLGTSSLAAHKILEHALNGKAPVVRKQLEKNVSVVDLEATELARQAVIDMREHFDHWLLHSDDDRSASVLSEFNERFGSIVPRSYTGQTVNPPGLAADFELRPHQHAAVARMIAGGDTLLAHPVGAGKTAEQIVGAFELRRLGVIRRPLFVAPNHMLGQMTADIQRLYPAAQVLASALESKDLVRVSAQMRSGDWDAIVITHNALGRWGLSPDAGDAINREINARLEADIGAVTEQSGRDDGRPTTMTKALQRRLANAQEKAKEQRAKAEARALIGALPFDESGVDYLVVDELHEFKNLGITTAAEGIRGVPGAVGSDKAWDLQSKLTWLRQANPGKPVIAGATGTPISNTVAEMWVMGQYVAPETMTRLGIGAFDSFRAQFCTTESQLELDETGTHFRAQTRLSRYSNLPELARWWGEFTDQVQVEDLGLPRPDVAGGGRQVVIVPPAPELTSWMRVEVAHRADAIRGRQVEPTEDNFLKLSSDLRRAAFDWEGFSGEPVDPANSTLAACAEKVAAVYHRTAGNTYRSPAGFEHPTPGALQLVFSDLGVPSPSSAGDSAYERLRDLMVAHGVPREQIAFARDHGGTPDAKEAFFEACRSGRVAVAISSTPLMGVGTNVQDRLVALHHLNAPWRPSDIEQREGRAIRQGNQNPEVELFAYATEKSASITAWQTLERKAGFIGQVMRATPDGPRGVDVVDDEVLSFGEIKALATGDPDFKLAAEREQEVSRLERLANGHRRQTSSAKQRAKVARWGIDDANRAIAQLEPLVRAMAEADPGPDGMPKWSLIPEGGGDPLTSRADAARWTMDKVGYSVVPVTVGKSSMTGGIYQFKPSGHRAGFLELVDAAGMDAGVPYVGVENRHDISELTTAFVTMSHREERAPFRQESHRQQVPVLEERLARALEAAEVPFAHTDALATARRELQDVRYRLEARYPAAGAEAGPEPLPEAAPPSVTRSALAPRVPGNPHVAAQQQGIER